jgi:hypothetical protein
MKFLFQAARFDGYRDTWRDPFIREVGLTVARSKAKHD